MGDKEKDSTEEMSSTAEATSSTESTNATTETVSATPTTETKSNTKKIVLIVVAVIVALICLCVALVIGLSALSASKVKTEADKVKSSLANITTTSSPTTAAGPKAVDISSLVACDGTNAGEDISVEGYFQAPHSIYCYGTCTLAFSTKFNAPTGTATIDTAVDYTKDDGANTVTFPSTYSDITDFTFRDKDNVELNVAKKIKATGVWQYTDNSDNPSLKNSCKLRVQSLEQAE
jgi:hypothetical protein